MLEISEKKQCCGCNACGDVCPQRAITFNRDEGGFLYPVIDAKKCNNCNLCVKVCPQNTIGVLRRTNDQKIPDAFAAIANNLELRFDSTSGGIFTILAEKILSQGGYVAGAVWDDSYLVHHILIDKSEELYKLRSSKYAQSDARGFYQNVEAKLKAGKKVLSCGLPCQMAALRSFLRKDYENLFVVDLICRSVSSPYFLQYYIQMHERKQHSKVVSIKQKDKGLGWRNLTTKLTFENGNVIYDPKSTSYFMRAFEANLVSRPSCYDCQFRGFPRIADITLADCWGAVDKLPEYMDNNIGTSLVLCNTTKGKIFYEEVRKSSDVTVCNVDLSDAIKGNFGLISSIPQPVINVSNLYEDMQTKPLEEVLDNLLKSPAGTIKIKTKFRLLRGLFRRAKRVFHLGRKLFSAIKINGINNILKCKPLLLTQGKVMFESDEKAEIVATADTIIGASLFRHSIQINSLRLYKKSKLVVNGGSIGSNCYIVLFENSCLEIGRNCCINVNFTVSCAESIKIGDNVFIGQHVTIRDTHGDHYINIPGYKPTKPIIICDHVWICSDAIIMPGVKIGPGAIVAARSLVNRDVPPNTLVGGIPARIIRENIQFRC